MSKKFSRRSFLKGGLAATGTFMAGGTAFSFSLDSLLNHAPKKEAKKEYFLNACSRDCYDTCSIISTVQDGVLKAVNGNPQQTYTNGHVCAKGYSYTRRMYSPDRIKYPMRQKKRGSGEWERISWDEAYTIIAKKILDIKKEYGSLEPVCLNWGTGTEEVIHTAPKGFFKSIGKTTKLAGDPCWPAGADATFFDFGAMKTNDPETFVDSKLIILWGINPSWTSIHSMHFIEQAQDRGAKVIVIDPVLSSTGSRADEYIQVRPTSDGALALGMCRYMLDHGLVDMEWLNQNAYGTEEFLDYLRKEVTVEWAAEKTGIPVEAIERLAHEYATTKPANIWVGYGMQRHTNGGQMVRSIDALAALSGNIGKKGGGVQYGQLTTWGFNYNTNNQHPPKDAGGKDRVININNFSEELLHTQDPPLKMVWFASRNAVFSDPEPNKTRKALDTMDLVVTCDQFLTPTVEYSDIVLPVTLFFETQGINVSYWHHWLSLNEQAVKPMYETKDDLTIVMELGKKMNELEPGSCTFPYNEDPDYWMDNEFNEAQYKLFGISNWRELRKGPVKAKGIETAWADGKFDTPTGKFELLCESAAEKGHPALPIYLEGVPQSEKYPLRFFPVHWPIGVNGQFQNLDWMKAISPEPYIELHPDTAAKHNIKEGDRVKVYNDIGSINVPAHITSTVSPDMAVTYNAWWKDNPNFANNLVKVRPTDMGSFKNTYAGTAFHDNFVAIKKETPLSMKKFFGFDKSDDGKE